LSARDIIKSARAVYNKHSVLNLAMRLNMPLLNQTINSLKKFTILFSNLRTVKVGFSETRKNYSPMLNSGNTIDLPNEMTTDLAGNPQLFGTTIKTIASKYQIANHLTVELINYTAKAKLNTAVLNWQTASEYNNKKFILSRSFNGTDFIEIGTVASLGNHKNSSNYSFTDINPAKGFNYYRLSWQDLNGKTKIIGLKTLGFGLNKEVLSVYPNPAEDAINIKFAANTYQNMFIINLGGHVTNTVKINHDQSELRQDVADLPKGTYVILMKGLSEQSQIKFIKK
jgi:hypothetical protein